ncbi:MAG: hypothetical protein ACRD3W_29745 [Terriglobales bacterium]
MDTSHPATAQACSATQQGEYVAKTLDQLEELGKYSVIYEMSRIETMLRYMFANESVQQLA